jgi:hypothetical protein
LKANEGESFIGSYVCGLGFTFDVLSVIRKRSFLSLWPA